jgi:hypothetical protein
MPWTVCRDVEKCGAEPDCWIPADAPVWESSVTAKVKRCASHAPEPVDGEAVAAARRRLEAETEARRQVNATQPTFVELERPRQPFDARLAAAGERQP